MQKTQSTTKPAAAKTTQKPAAAKTQTSAPTKAAAKGKTLFYKTLLADCLAGKLGAILQRYFTRAVEYHEKQKTQFPRRQCADHPLLTADDARAFLLANCGTQYDGKEFGKGKQFPKLEPGNKTGQRIFDQMMIEAKAK